MHYELVGCQDWELRHRKMNLHFNWSERLEKRDFFETKVYKLITFNL